MIECFYPHIEDNKDHSQLDDLMNLSMSPIEDEPTEDELLVSLPMVNSYPIFEYFSFELPNAVLAINIDQESVADQYDTGKIHGKEPKGIYQTNREPMVRP